jgi:mannosylglycoprotein endo-beta-mannosidase
VNKKIRRELQEELLDLENLEEEGMLSLMQLNKKIHIQKKLMLILDEEELYWYKRSHGRWLHEGGNNTNFFHRMANGRKRSNVIINFVHEGGLIEGDDNLLQHATNYYKSLFGAVSETSFPINPEMWRGQEKVSEEDNEKLIKPFAEKEIKYALFQMKKNKAAGPDKIPIEFYQSCGAL